MAFKLTYSCEFCGHTIHLNSKDNAEDFVCDCELEHEPATEPMSKEEQRLRYRLQYIENGYTWDDKSPWMYTGLI